ncbi:wall-associated receptor kinase-like 2 [Beta vulgaris subsp. vulgaris]|uniref:wall-associated receptor kinase-like 2 n=1 Tax=Beta vulgaris subsp. vulgaris TaxID=3555 RepID=UPI00203747B5|nr:wall-associated receptor kinase-like 2 [Beta vulgaris subsp. vulgaris]
MDKFTLSTTQNYFGAIGCDTYIWLYGEMSIERRKVRSGCMTACAAPADIGDSNICSGIGCCLVSIPNGVTNLDLEVHSFHHQNITDFNPCNVAFIVAKDYGAVGALPFSVKEMLTKNGTFYQPLQYPVVYDWSIGYQNCRKAQLSGEYLCKGNSTCIDWPYREGYRCQCKPGFRGNPYLYACQDIDECLEENSSPCRQPAICFNTKGNYTCKCPQGYSRRNSEDMNDLCIAENPKLSMLIIKIIGGFTLGLIILIPFGWWSYSENKRRQDIKRRANNFERNGGILLQQQMSSDERVVDRIKIFTSNELEKATDNFNEDRILGQGGHGTVYKGMLGEGRIVAVKKSNKLEESERGEFINEVVILSQINHRNILKLLGCCLETEVPLLVYEFIPNGTLSHHIHNPSEEFPITWKMRLQIASDIAGALAYLHSSSSTLIYHRDIKSSNILLDDKYRAKLSDFGTSRAVDIDQTHVVTRVMGTFGYMDPEYFQSHQFTEKSDVYSFGVVLVELLTGQKAVRAASEQDRSLTGWFLSHMESSSLFDIVDHQVFQEGSEEEFLTIANLARQCLNLDGKSRPTMKQVLIELEVVLSLHVPQANDPKKPKSELVFAGTTSNSQHANTFYLENSASNSAEVSLLFNPR